MSDHHDFPSQDRLNVLPNQSVTVENFQSDGFILDIGGGGEGVIGCLKGSLVVALDTRIAELKEAPAGPHKVVMDACRMALPDDTFSTVTAFFSMMFITESSHLAALEEILRVMQPDGRFYLWDIVMPPRTDESRDVTAFNLEIRLPDRMIRTGYGARTPVIAHDMEYYRRLAAAAGFRIASQRQENAVIFLALHKAS